MSRAGTLIYSINSLFEFDFEKVLSSMVLKAVYSFKLYLIKRYITHC